MANQLQSHLLETLVIGRTLRIHPLGDPASSGCRNGIGLVPRRDSCFGAHGQSGGRPYTSGPRESRHRAWIPPCGHETTGRNKPAHVARTAETVAVMALGASPTTFSTLASLNAFCCPTDSFLESRSRRRRPIHQRSSERRWLVLPRNHAMTRRWRPIDRAPHIDVWGLVAVGWLLVCLDGMRFSSRIADTASLRPLWRLRTPRCRFCFDWNRWAR